MLLAMHIPDGFLDPITTVVTAGLALLGLAVALQRLQQQLGSRLAPLLGVMAAAIFAAQMVNFPLLVVPASGHVLGGVLAAVLLGPWGGLIAMTAVLIVQCLLFADGGLTALGANIVNMGLIGSCVGHLFFTWLRRHLQGLRGTVIAAAVASWLVVPLAALAFAVEMAGSGDYDFVPLAWLLLCVHVPIGLGEALITGLTLTVVARLEPTLLPRDEAPMTTWRPRYLTAAGLSVALATAVFAAPWASSLSDGLEWVAVRLGFAERATSLNWAPLADYQWPHISTRVGTIPPEWSHSALATMSIGVAGTLVTWVLGHLVSRRVAWKEELTEA